MKAISLVIALGALAAAQRTALWVPECGDEVLMLGTDVADEFRSLNTLSVEDINKILAFHTLPCEGPPVRTHYYNLHDAILRRKRDEQSDSDRVSIEDHPTRDEKCHNCRALTAFASGSSYFLLHHWAAMTYGGRPMLFEVKAVACDPESGVSGGAVSFESPTGRPTDALQASNKALWPCVNLWNIWEKMQGEVVSAS
ncbi:hypothetical protein MY1884_005972 [Beauveria asiatica]